MGHDYNSSKISTMSYQCHIKYTQYLMVHTPKTFQAIHIYFKKSEKPLNVVCTHLFFALAIIVIFDGLFFT